MNLCYGGEFFACDAVQCFIITKLQEKLSSMQSGEEKHLISQKEKKKSTNPKLVQAFKNFLPT